MKGELKAGGLALVFGLQVKPEANGKVVHLIEMASGLQSAFIAIMLGDPVEQWWRVKGLLPDGKIAQVRPQNLMPIDDSDPDAVDELSKDKPVEVTD